MSVDSASNSAIAPRRSGRAASLVLLSLALIGVAAGGFSLYLQLFANPLEQQIVRLRLDTETTVVAAKAESDAARRALDGLGRRLEDAQGVNRSLREELLGLSERARLIEDALAGMAERRLDGATALRLNEAEFLLGLSAERLKLFRDPHAAVEGFKLADAELAAVGEPVLASVRQSIATEIDALGKMPELDQSTLLAALDRVLADLPQLPTRAENERLAAAQPVAGGLRARLAASLASFVRIERVSPSDAALLNPLNADAARAVVALDLTLAKAALVAGDAARFRAAIARARSGLAETFAADNERVAAALAVLDRQREAPVDAPLPQVGRALEELKNLRATRAIAHDVPHVAPPRAP